MKTKLATLALLTTLVAPSAFAGGPHYYHRSPPGGMHHNSWIAPLIIGGGIGYIISQNQQPKETIIIQQPPAPATAPSPRVIYVYPTTAPVITAPSTVCELRSENINGEIVTGNWCYQR